MTSGVNFSEMRSLLAQLQEDDFRAIKAAFKVAKSGQSVDLPSGFDAKITELQSEITSMRRGLASLSLYKNNGILPLGFETADALDQKILSVQTGINLREVTVSAYQRAKSLLPLYLEYIKTTAKKTTPVLVVLTGVVAAVSSLWAKTSDTPPSS